MRVFALLIVIGIGALGPVASQTAHVRVDAPAGTVLVDGDVAGPVGTWLAVGAGERDVALVDDPVVWNPRRASRTITLAEGDSVTVRLVLPRRVRVETLPLRALVVREGSPPDTLGTAPLTLDLPPDETAALVATLDGYAPARARARLGADVDDLDAEMVTLVLMPADGAPEPTPVLTHRGVSRQTWVDVGIGAAAVAAGAVAVHYKFRADRIDDRYRDPEDPGFADEALRQDALRLDRLSTVALVAMQVGVGALAIRFVMR